MENIDRSEHYYVAISEISNVASTQKVTEFIKVVVSKFVSNGAFIVNQELISCYYSLITEIINTRLKFIHPNWVLFKEVIDIGIKHKEQKVRDSALDLLNSITKGVMDVNMNNRFIKNVKFGQKLTNPTDVIKLTIENDYENYRKVLDDVVIHYIYPQIYNITNNLILNSI